MSRRLARAQAGFGAALSLLLAAQCSPFGNHPACRAHADPSSCRGDHRCQESRRCEPSKDLAGRCSKFCTPAGAGCVVTNPARPDTCETSFRDGHFEGCRATDRDPNRCRLVMGEGGVPSCIDTAPPCAGCVPVFDRCDVAYSVCHGIFCF